MRQLLKESECKNSETSMAWYSSPFHWKNWGELYHLQIMNVRGCLFIFTHINMKYTAINLYHIHIAIL